jgi:hypothetical protein
MTNTNAAFDGRTFEVNTWKREVSEVSRSFEFLVSSFEKSKIDHGDKRQIKKGEPVGSP